MMTKTKTTTKKLTVEQWRSAIRIAGIEQDSVERCEPRSDGSGWNISVSLHGVREYFLTPDGRYSPR